MSELINVLLTGIIPILLCIVLYIVGTWIVDWGAKIQRDCEREIRALQGDNMADINPKPMNDAIAEDLAKTKLRKAQHSYNKFIGELNKKENNIHTHQDYKCEQCGGLQRIRDDYQGALRCETCGGGLSPITGVTVQKQDNSISAFVRESERQNSFLQKVKNDALKDGNYDIVLQCLKAMNKNDLQILNN